MVEGVDLFLLVPVEEHLGAAVNQESSEYEQYPGESADEGCTSKDEDEAKHDGSQNTPVQYVLVIFLIHSKRGEDHHHHEEVIYRERLFYQITRDVGDGHIVAILLQTPFVIIRIQFEMRSIARGYQLQVVEVLYAVHHVAMEVDEHGEGESENDPYSRPGASFLDGNHMRLSVDDQHV